MEMIVAIHQTYDGRTTGSPRPLCSLAQKNPHGFDNRNIRVLFMLIISTLVSLVTVLLYLATEFE